jgi:hypothetical protein
MVAQRRISSINGQAVERRSWQGSRAACTAAIHFCQIMVIFMLCFFVMAHATHAGTDNYHFSIPSSVDLRRAEVERFRSPRKARLLPSFLSVRGGSYNNNGMNYSGNDYNGRQTNDNHNNNYGNRGPEDDAYTHDKERLDEQTGLPPSDYYPGNDSPNHNHPVRDNLNNFPRNSADRPSYDSPNNENDAANGPNTSYPEDPSRHPHYNRRNENEFSSPSRFENEHNRFNNPDQHQQSHHPYGRNYLNNNDAEIQQQDESHHLPPPNLPGPNVYQEDSGEAGSNVQQNGRQSQSPPPELPAIYPPGEFGDEQAQPANMGTGGDIMDDEFDGQEASPSEMQLQSMNKDLIYDGLKRLYRKRILPLELASKYGHFHSPPMSPSDFDARPMVLLLGQYRYIHTLL